MLKTIREFFNWYHSRKTMNLYRIFIEDKNRQDVIDMVSKYFNSFTVLSGTVYLKNQPKNCLIIEISTDVDYTYFYPLTTNALERLCWWIKEHNEQDAVLVEFLNVDTVLL
jgi:glycosylphosphatidylinositol transamidase (GPIT) subunit GPI8